jgi:import receptor subunit TOM70
MSAQPVPAAPFRNVNLDTSSFSPAGSAPSQSFWNRVSAWASENKVVVYTIAGVVVVATGAGVVYYLQDPKKDQAQAEERRASKKERRKAKKEKEQQSKQENNKAEPKGT